MFKRRTYEWRTATRRSDHSLRKLAIFVVVLVALLGICGFVTNKVYLQNLQAVSNDQTAKDITIKVGSSSSDIAKQLQEAGLIRSSWSFELYLHIKQLDNELQAGTYSIAPNQSASSIVNILRKGHVTSQLVTILPGRRIDQVRSDLINAGFTPASVEAALNPGNYADIPVMAYKPANANLEGMLYPDSFQRTAQTDPQTIIRQSLQLMGEHLTPDLIALYQARDLTPYQGLILSSIVEKEVSNADDKPQVAQVFYKRIAIGMQLGSDVTAFYGSILDGAAVSVSHDSPYNTRLYNGLPPTPISTVSQKSLEAVANPANTDWLYFVSGDNGKTYFSKTLEDHEAQTAQYCHELCKE